MNHGTADQVARQAAILADSGAVMEFRCINRKTGKISSIWKPVEQAVAAVTISELQRANAAGLDIYIGANPRAGVNLRGDKNVPHARVVFIDDDSGTDQAIMLARIAEMGLPAPTMVIFSGRGNWYFWRLSEAIDPKTFTRVQKDLAAALGTDPVVCNPERVVRLAGFVNHKPEAKGQRAQLTICEPDRVYGLDEIVDRLPVQETPADDEPEVDEQMAKLLEERAKALKAANLNGQASVIDALNDAHDIGTMLRAHGFREARKPDHYWRPGKDNGVHSVIVRDNRSFHFSSNDPFNDRKFGRGAFAVHDCFDIFRIAGKFQDFGSAVRAAAKLMGMEYKSHEKKEASGASSEVPKTDLADAAEHVEPPPEWVPFPVDQLPPVLADFIRDAERALQIDAAFVAVPLITAAGAAIGNTNRGLLKSGFEVPPLLWTGVVATSGDGKSPGMDVAMKAARRQQMKYVANYDAAVAEYQQQKAEYDALPKGEKAETTAPRPPSLIHNIVSDATTEALAPRLVDSDRGLLSSQDELAALFGAMNQYKSHGNDRESWLGFYDARFAKIDRKSAAVATIVIPHPFVAVTGGIQPRILSDLLNSDHVDSGMLPRFLFAMPPSFRRTWNDNVISEDVDLALASLFDALYSLPVRHEDGQIKPFVLPLSDDARRTWADWFNEIEEEIGSMIDRETPYALALPKIRTAAARMALIMQIISHVSGEKRAAGNHIDSTSMRRGVALARWFKEEQHRVYVMLSTNSTRRQLLRMSDMIREMGGTVSVREWMRKRRQHKTIAAAEIELGKLIDAGFAEWRYVQHPNGGRPSKSVTLRDNTPDSESESGVTSVTSKGGFNNPLSSIPASLGEGPKLSPSLSCDSDHTPRHGVKNGSNVPAGGAK